MFGALLLVTVASGWVVNLTLAGRGLALAFFAPVGLSLLSQRVATADLTPVALGISLTMPVHASAAGSVLYWPGWRWACCGRRAPGRYWERYLPGFVHPGQATTGGLLLAYGSGGALMLFLLGWWAALIADCVADRRSANGCAVGRGQCWPGGADRQRRRSLSAERWWTEPAGAAAGRLPAAAGAKDQPPADRRAAAQQRDALSGGGAAHGSTARLTRSV